MGTIKSFEATVLAVAETEFLRDLSDTNLLAVAGELLGPEWSGCDLPAVTVRRLLLEPGRVADKDAVWRHLVSRARECGGVWMLAAIGMAAPMLKRTAAIAAERFDSMRKDDLAAEVLAGFLEHLAVIDIERPGACVRLRWATWRRRPDAPPGISELSDAVSRCDPVGTLAGGARAGDVHGDCERC
ncbi:hypothetical protein KGQ20_02645 [Catenulispora sp. NF23]|uniref:hypothetical protein n=1 Tax=Catenulispora pinistramenti TaxID=2705254 RepID=UPI001BA8D47F|nr:hypothetical protein [Catenulispora pinistramenti]MBS2531664.1 hypothetical protein [Catenulispora pinistramenti]